MNPQVAEKIAEIRQDRVHGASWLSRQALYVTKLAIEKSEAKAVAPFLEELTAVGRELVESRPGMAPVANLVSYLIYQVSEKSGEGENLDALKSFALKESDRLVKYSEEAARKAAEQGAGVIESGDRLMTCSCSSTVCQAFRIARVKGIEVIAIESGSYGEATAQQLRSWGIKVKVVPNEAIRQWMPRVNKVLVGADSILRDGSLINGTPTYEVASAAKDSSIPFYVVGETTKFDFQSCLNEETKPGFDKVPPDLITGIITEEGIMKPGEVINRIEHAHP